MGIQEPAIRARLVVVPGVETIDASHVDTSLLGHSYFAETRSVLSDMFYLIRTGRGLDMRFWAPSCRRPSGADIGNLGGESTHT